MTDMFTVTLPAPFGRLCVVETTDYAVGSVRYLVSGRRLSGVFVFRPLIEQDLPIPTRVSVEFGDDPDGYRGAAQRVDRPTVNGTVDLVGATTIDPHRDQPLTRRDLTLHRPTGPHTSRPVPDKTATYVAAVLDVLRRRWRHHPDRDTLTRTAARLTAARRISDIERLDIPPRLAQRAALDDEIRHYQTRVAQLRQILDSPAQPEATP